MQSLKCPRQTPQILFSAQPVFTGILPSKDVAPDFTNSVPAQRIFVDSTGQFWRTGLARLWVLCYEWSWGCAANSQPQLSQQLRKTYAENDISSVTSSIALHQERRWTTVHDKGSLNSAWTPFGASTQASLLRNSAKAESCIVLYFALLEAPSRRSG